MFNDSKFLLARDKKLITVPGKRLTLLHLKFESFDLTDTTIKEGMIRAELVQNNSGKSDAVSQKDIILPTYDKEKESA